MRVDEAGRGEGEEKGLSELHLDLRLCFGVCEVKEFRYEVLRLMKRRRGVELNTERFCR